VFRIASISTVSTLRRRRRDSFSIVPLLPYFGVMRPAPHSPLHPITLMLIDAHSHLHHYPATRLPDVLHQMEQHAIQTLAVSVDLPTYLQSRALAAQSPLILPALGIHPWQATAQIHTLEAFTPYLAEAAVIGEIVLDFHWERDPATYPAQRHVLEFFLAAARDLRKPVNLHTKGAEGEILGYLRHYGIQGALIHWYSGDMATFEELVADGHYFSIGVELLFSEAIRAFASALPLSHLLTETDNPTSIPWLCEEHPSQQSLWAAHLEDKFGMPSAILPVYEALATLKGISLPQLEGIIADNYQRYLNP
jgi:TatD DNase family protein